MAHIRQVFAIDGMHCASCTLLIDEVLEDLDGVRRSATSLRRRRTVVEYDPNSCTPEAVAAAIAEAGYTGAATKG
jgi:copper chaperone CopZ